jgi:hypothetical protein
LLPALVNYALRVEKETLVGISPSFDHELQARDTSGSSAVDHDLDILNILLLDLERVDETSEAHDGSTVLIVMENWNVHHFLELLLNIKAVWALDVLQVDTGEAWRKILDTVDEIIWVLGVDTEVNTLNSSEFVEQNRLSLHDGLGGQSADIAEAQDCSTICNDSHHVSLVCVSVGEVWVLLNLETWLSNTWRVS